MKVLLSSLVFISIGYCQSITPLTTNQIDAFKPFTYYASAAYCQPSTTTAWTCGSNCNANPTFKPTASGGDGQKVPFWFVGYDSTLNTVIVSYQGENTSSAVAELQDADFFLDPLDTSLFPGVSSSIEVHNGFQNDFRGSATHVLAAVKDTLSIHGTKEVTIVGHSTGGALALLSSVYLPLQLPSGMTFKSITFGQPRVGNQAFADYVDSNCHLTHINNRKDVIPILPGMFLGFHHAAGEVHILDSGSWVSCPGQDNESTECIVGDVPNVFEGDINDNNGPYNGINIGC